MHNTKDKIKEELESYIVDLMDYVPEMRAKITSGDIAIDELGEMFKNILLNEMLNGN